jgi:spermidine/putrescine transport system permease protein
MDALYTTLTVAVLAALCATIIGTVSAIGIHSLKRRPRLAMMNLTYIPVTNPDIVTGVSLMLLFLFMKMPMGFGTLLIAHVTFNIPYVILSVMPKLQQMNKHLYEAALDLGATPYSALVKVILPQIMPGIFTGAILAFTLSLDDFVISFFTNGGTQTLSVVIYSMARLGVKPQINALSTILFVSVLTLLFIVNKRTSKDAV